LVSEFEADSQPYYDPLYGKLSFEPVFRSAMNLKSVQRLRHLKQLDVLDIIFPGATHTRFAHSVGVLKVTSDIINHLLDLQFRSLRAEWPPIGIPHILATQLAALFHDVGCGPLSTIFELFCRYTGFHDLNRETVSTKLITEGLGEFNDIPIFLDQFLRSTQESGIEGDLNFLRPDTIASISQGRPPPPPADPRYLFLSQIVSSAIDANRIDYLARDAFHTIGETNVIHREQIVDSMTITREMIGREETFVLRVNKEAAMDVEALLSTHELMGRRVYFNSIHRGNQELLIRALMDLATKISPEDLCMKTDEEIQELLAEYGAFTKNVIRRLSLGTPYVHLPYDIQVHRDLGEEGRQNWAELRGLRRGEVFVAEKRLAAELGLEFETIVLVLNEPTLTLKGDYFSSLLYDSSTGKSTTLVDVLPHLLLTKGTLNTSAHQLIDLGSTYANMLAHLDAFVPLELYYRVVELAAQRIRRSPRRKDLREVSEIVREELGKPTSPLRVVFDGMLDLLQFPSYDRQTLWNRCLIPLSRQIEGLVKIEVDRGKAQIRSLPRLTQPVKIVPPKKRIAEGSDQVQLARNIVQLIGVTNAIVDRLIPGFVMFRSDMEIGSEIHSPCTNQDDFSIRIGAIATIFDVETEALRKVIRNPKQEWKSIRLIEEWMSQMGARDWKQATVVWKRIKELRNASFPYHPGSSEIVELVKYFGGDFPVDYPRLWLGVLQRFRQSLEDCQRLLKDFG
jgi:HD superfamily phosphohydrolase